MPPTCPWWFSRSMPTDSRCPLSARGLGPGRNSSPLRRRTPQNRGNFTLSLLLSTFILQLAPFFKMQPEPKLWSDGNPDVPVEKTASNRMFPKLHYFYAFHSSHYTFRNRRLCQLKPIPRLAPGRKTRRRQNRNYKSVASIRPSGLSRIKAQVSTVSIIGVNSLRWVSNQAGTKSTSLKTTKSK